MLQADDKHVKTLLPEGSSLGYTLGLTKGALDWNKLYEHLGVKKEPLCYVLKGNILGLDRLLATFEAEEISNYFVFQMVRKLSILGLLPRRFTKQAFALEGSRPTKLQQAFGQVEDVFSWELGKLYVERTLGDTAKAGAQKIADSILQEAVKTAGTELAWGTCRLYESQRC